MITPMIVAMAPLLGAMAPHLMWLHRMQHAAAPWLIACALGLPWLGALVVWLVGDQRPKTQHTLAVIFSALAGVAALGLLPFASAEAQALPPLILPVPLGSLSGASLTFRPDGLGVFLAAVATVIGSLAVVFSVDYMRHTSQLGRYYALVLLFIGAMVGLALTGSFLFLFIFWEITALCSYALISFYNDDPKAVAGGVKALIITSVGGVGLFAGALAINALLGSDDIQYFIAHANELPPGALAWLAFCFLAAAAAKSAQFPFQTWLPDAMEAPSPVSALIHAATMVNAGVYLLARFYPAFADVPGWRTAVMAVGMLSALLAALMAVAANDLKRALAYSTVSQLGFMVYAVGAGGIFASQFHLFSHAVFKALLFLAAGAVIHTVGTRDLNQMGGLGQKMPFVRNTFLAGALALAGVPVMNGFWSKELILEAGMEGGPQWMWATMLGVAGLTGLYTFRLVWLVFFDRERGPLHGHDAAHPIHGLMDAAHPTGGATDAPPMMRVALGTLAVGSASTWLVVGPFGHMLHETLPYHELHAPSLGDLIGEVMGNPFTWLALLVIAGGAGLFWINIFYPSLGKWTSRLQWAALSSFGFEWANRQVVGLIRALSALSSRIQTGKLNWNVLGIVATLAALLAWVYLGK